MVRIMKESLKGVVMTLLKPSQLVAIVQRLQINGGTRLNIEVRRFEKDGVEKAIVTFNQKQVVLN